MTRFTDLGLRILMYLSQHKRPDPVTNAELAKQLEASHNHVIKVVNRLARLGWVTTQRGRHGGLWLGIPPERLRLGQALRAIEEATELVDCEHPPCVLRRRCLLKHALDDALSAFYERMDQYTLADVCKGGTGDVLVSLHRKFPASAAR